jgi:hypothetical protein
MLLSGYKLGRGRMAE